MSDNGEEEADEPVVELGDGPDVEGAPVSRVASRLFFPIEESEVLRREGETTIRTPDGTQTVGDVLEETDDVYFETNADLVDAVRSVVGTGPVPTAGGDPGDGSDSDSGSDSDGAGETDADDGSAEEGGFEFDDADANGDGDGGGAEDSEVEGDGDSDDGNGDGDEDGAVAGEDGGSDGGEDGDDE